MKSQPSVGKISRAKQTIMIVVSVDFVARYNVTQTLGLVQGSTVRAKHVGRDIAASLKSIFGGEIRSYTELLDEARWQAMDRMIASARQKGANAIIGVRFESSSVMQGANELYCYGTAVVIKKES
jgi:uncharacterized protein YbjQ (UPF0145 family)